MRAVPRLDLIIFGLASGFKALNQLPRRSGQDWSRPCTCGRWNEAQFSPHAQRAARSHARGGPP